MTLEGPCRPEPLVDAIAGFLTHVHVRGVDDIRETVAHVIDDAGPGALEELRRRLVDAGTEWSYFPKDPLAQRLHHVLAGEVLREPPVLLGARHLDELADAPVILFANHLSYIDANVLEVALHQGGRQALAERLAVVAGPKVYSDLKRRFSSLCFGTIKVPQSAGRASGEAVMTARDLATAARRSIRAAQERLARGEALLVFPEGTRSRTATMGPFLPGVSRYLKDVDVWVMPVGLCGTESLFPMGEGSFNPVRVTVRAGRPVRSRELVRRAGGDRRLLMHGIGFAVAALLPEEYRGCYAIAAHDLSEANALSEELFREDE